MDDHELTALTAPRPFLKLSSREDWHVPVAGCERAMLEVQRVYRLLGAPERVRHCMPAYHHGLDWHGMAAAYNWFDHWLKGEPLLDEAGLRQLGDRLARRLDIPAAEFRYARQYACLALHASDFSGGSTAEPAHVLGGKERWTERAVILSALPEEGARCAEAEFSLPELPARPVPVLLRGTVTGNERVRLRVSLNGETVFDEEGAWHPPFAAKKLEHPEPRFLLDPGVLRKGRNTLTVENVSQPLSEGGRPHFLLFYVISQECGAPQVTA